MHGAWKMERVRTLGIAKDWLSLKRLHLSGREQNQNSTNGQKNKNKTKTKQKRN